MTTIDIIFDNSFLLGIVIIVLFFVFHKKLGFYIFKIENAQIVGNIVDNDDTHCSDKNCVRCFKYREVLDAATAKLSTLEDDDMTLKIKESLQNGLTQTHKTQSEQNPNVFYDAFLCGKYFLNKYCLSEELNKDINMIENSHEAVFEEFKSVYNSNYEHIWNRNSTVYGSWDVFHLVNQGNFIEENCALCPTTTTLIKQLKSVMTGNVFGNILFSVVKPSTLIAPHYGPTNIRLRCHLGLVITDKCVLHVGKEQRTWCQGECIVFDDSFLHSVEHNGIKLQSNEVDERSLLEPGDRAVLIMDLWHPELSHKERTVLDFLFSSQPP